MPSKDKAKVKATHSKWRAGNSELIKLKNTKYYVNDLKKRIENPEYDQEKKAKSAARSKAYRDRKKLAQQVSTTSDEDHSEPVPSQLQLSDEADTEPPPTKK